MGRVLAFVPARAGSKGIPDKNIRPMNGRPMVYYTLLAALESCADVVVLSSDSERVHETARESLSGDPGLARLTHHQRPVEIAGDASPISESILHYLAGRSETFEFIVLLQPTSPIRKRGHIDEAIARMRASENNTL